MENRNHLCSFARTSRGRSHLEAAIAVVIACSTGLALDTYTSSGLAASGTDMPPYGSNSPDVRSFHLIGATPSRPRRLTISYLESLDYTFVVCLRMPIVVAICLMLVDWKSPVRAIASQSSVIGDTCFRTKSRSTAAPGAPSSSAIHEALGRPSASDSLASHAFEIPNSRIGSFSVQA